MTDNNTFHQIAPKDAPIDAATFYEKRDDRTVRIVESHNYRDAEILLLATPDVANSTAGQVSLLTAANITSRFCRHVDVVTDDVTMANQSSTKMDSLHSQCYQEMQAADPFGSFDISTDVGENEYDAALVFGDESVSAGTTIHAIGGGWRGHVFRTDYTAVDEKWTAAENPIGPAVAACLGTAELFKSLVGVADDALCDSMTFDAFGMEYVEDGMELDERPSFPEVIALGDVQMVGVGAVGSSLLYFLRYLPVDGALTLVDHDEVEYSNLNRSPLFSARDAVYGTNKATVGERFMKGRIPTTAYSETYNDYVEAQGAGTPDVVIPVANERGVRATIQENYPPVMVHTTTGDWKIHNRRHIPTVDACLRCHFPVEAPRPEGGCARGELPDQATVSDSAKDEDNTPDAALPFVSMFAGVLLAGELVKLTLSDYPYTRNIVEVGLNPPFDFSSTWTKRDECGFCNNLDEDLYRSLIQNTRFATLSNVKDDKQ